MKGSSSCYFHLRTSTFAVEVVPALKEFRVNTTISDDCLHPDDIHMSMVQYLENCMICDCLFNHSFSFPKIGKNLWNNILSPAREHVSLYRDNLEVQCPDAGAPLPLTPTGTISPLPLLHRQGNIQIDPIHAYIIQHTRRLASWFQGQFIVCALFINTITIIGHTLPESNKGCVPL